MRRRTADVNLTRMHSIDRSSRDASCTTSHDSRKSTACLEVPSTDRGRSHEGGGASRPVVTRTEPSTPRPHVLGSQNLPCPRPMTVHTYKKTTLEYASSTTLRTTEHVRYISFARTPARGGATGTIGASDLVHRSIPRPTTTDASWSRLESDRSERDATRERGRAVSSARRRNPRERGESIESIESNRARI